LDSWITHALPGAVAYAASLLGDREKADDIVQECVCRLLLTAARYNLPRDGRRLLFRSITNACINAITRERGEMSLDEVGRASTNGKWELQDAAAMILRSLGAIHRRPKAGSAIYAIAVVAFASVAHAATWYVGPGGSGTGTSAASPVGSLNAAYLQASSGDEILVLDGTYGAQTVAARAVANTWASNVTIEPAPGANPVFTGSTQVSGAHVTVDGFTFDNFVAARGGSDYFVLENSILKGGSSFNSSHTVISDNQFVDGQDVDAVRFQGATNGTPNTDILFENNLIKNYTSTGSGSHVDGIQIINSSNITISGNRIEFDGNAGGILFTPTVGPVFNVLIENNFMVQGPNGGKLLNLTATSTHGISLINNTLIGSVDMDKGSLNDNVARNNIFSRFTADSVANQPIHDHNYIYGSTFNITLNPTDVFAAGAMPSFANVSDIDLHITPANTVNLAIGSTLGAPLYDIDGQLRPQPLWVGADQVLAVPEPSTIVLAAWAIAATVFVYRRKR
jgi:hypothetical protein